MLNKLYSGFLLAVIFCVTVHVLVSNLRLTPLVWVGLGILSIVLGRFLKHLAISLGLMVGGSLIILDCVPFWGIYGNGMPMIIVLTILGFGGIFISILKLIDGEKETGGVGKIIIGINLFILVIIFILSYVIFLNEHGAGMFSGLASLIFVIISNTILMGLNFFMAILSRYKKIFLVNVSLIFLLFIWQCFEPFLASFSKPF